MNLWPQLTDRLFQIFWYNRICLLLLVIATWFLTTLWFWFLMFMFRRFILIGWATIWGFQVDFFTLTFILFYFWLLLLWTCLFGGQSTYLLLTVTTFDSTMLWCLCRGISMTLIKKFWRCYQFDLLILNLIEIWWMLNHWRSWCDGIIH